MKKFLYQRPEKEARNQKGTVYHWTPYLAKKRGMKEITEEQARRIQEGEDASVVLAPTDSEGKVELPPDHVLMAVPNSLVNKVRAMIQEGDVPEIVKVSPVVPGAADKEFAKAPELVEPKEEPVNLRPVEVVKVEKARSVNTVEKLNGELPDEFKAELSREKMDLDEMKAAVIKGYQAKILAEAEKE